MDTVARIMFVHSRRIADTIVTLQFDRFLDPPPAHTFIHFGPWEIDQDLSYNLLGPVDILDVYKQHGIDTSRITLVFDNDLLKSFPLKVDVFNYSTGTGRDGNWIKQQMLKFIALDQCPYDKILIQDADIVPIKPYRYFNGAPVNYVSTMTHPPGYYKYFTKLTGHARPSDCSFICEFFPIEKSTWASLKTQLETRFHTNWFTAIHQMIVSSTDDPNWFSEYELLGNWALVQNPLLQTKLQHRLWLVYMRDLDDLTNLHDPFALERTWNKDINCIGLNIGTELTSAAEIVAKLNSVLEHHNT